MRSYPVANNTLVLTVALVVQKVMSFGYFWYLSNQLEKTTLGMYLFALSFAALFGGATDLGLTPILIRETARDPAAGNRYLRAVLAVKFLLCAAVVALAVLAVNIGGHDVASFPPEVRPLIFLALGFVVMDAFTLSLWGVLKAFRNLRYESVATLVVQLVIIAGGALVLATSGSPRRLVLVLVLASATNFLFAAHGVSRRVGYRLAPDWNQPTIRRLLSLAPAFALSLVFVRIFNVADTVLLGYLSHPEAVANYAIPAKVVTSLQQIIPAAFATAIFPVFTGLYLGERDKLRWLFSRACAYLIGISLPLSVALIIAAPKILATVWPAYANVTGSFRVMAAALPFIFLSFPSGYLLNACDRQRQNTINRGLVTAFAVFANVALIPPFGYAGAAAVFLGSNVLLVALDFSATQMIAALDLPYLRQILAKTALAVLAMGAAAWLMLPLASVFVTLAAAAVTYLGVTMALKTWPPIGELFRQIRGTAVKPYA